MFGPLRTWTQSNIPNDPNDPNDLPTEGETCGPAPEIEIAGRQREAVVLFRVLEVAEVAQIAAEADVIGHEPHRTEPDVHPPVVAVNAEQLFRIFDVRLHQPQAATDIRAEPGTGLAADGDAQNHIRHQVLHVVAIREADVV